jgi:hypothetical protein
VRRTHDEERRFGWYHGLAYVTTKREAVINTESNSSSISSNSRNVEVSSTVGSVETKLLACAELDDLNMKSMIIAAEHDRDAKMITCTCGMSILSSYMDDHFELCVDAKPFSCPYYNCDAKSMTHRQYYDHILSCARGKIECGDCDLRHRTFGSYHYHPLMARESLDDHLLFRHGAIVDTIPMIDYTSVQHEIRYPDGKGNFYDADLEPFQVLDNEPNAYYDQHNTPTYVNQCTLCHLTLQYNWYHTKVPSSSSSSSSSSSPPSTSDTSDGMTSERSRLGSVSLSSIPLPRSHDANINGNGIWRRVQLSNDEVPTWSLALLPSSSPSSVSLFSRPNEGLSLRGVFRRHRPLRAVAMHACYVKWLELCKSNGHITSGNDVKTMEKLGAWGEIPDYGAYGVDSSSVPRPTYFPPKIGSDEWRSWCLHVLNGWIT